LSEKKTDWGGIAILVAVGVGAYLLTRKVEAAPPPIPTQAPTQQAVYCSGQGNIVATDREHIGEARSQTITAGQAGTAAQKWEDPIQAPLFHFSKYPADVPPQPGQVVGVQAPRPWAGLTGEGLFDEALEAPLYWSGPAETAGLILVPERYRPIIEKYGLDALRKMRSPADPAYAEIEKQYGRETANLMIRYALELSNGVAKGYAVEYVTKEHMKILGNKVDERFLADWVLAASVTHPGGDPGTVKTRAAQMHLSEEEYKYVGLRYFYELHGYIPDNYKVLWATLDPKYHDTWKGFPKEPLPRTYTSPSLSGLTYSLEEYKRIFGTVPWDEPIPTYRKEGKQWYVWGDPQKPGSVQWGTMDDYKKSMGDAEKAKAPEKVTPEEKRATAIERRLDREQKASTASSIPATKPAPAEKPPTSTPVNPRTQYTTRAAAGQREMTRQVEAKERVAAGVERINKERAAARVMR